MTTETPCLSGCQWSHLPSYGSDIHAEGCPNANPVCRAEISPCAMEGGKHAPNCPNAPKPESLMSAMVRVTVEDNTNAPKPAEPPACCSHGYIPACPECRSVWPVGR